jgi:hypothetical protein
MVRYPFRSDLSTADRELLRNRSLVKELARLAAILAIDRSSLRD